MLWRAASSPPPFFVDAARRCGPAEERRDRARNRADLERPVRALLQRRVREHVEKIREDREEGGRSVDADREDRDGRDGENDAENQGETRRHAARGERPV